MCQHGIFKTFVSRTNESGCTFRLDCNCWSCSTCRPKLESDWSSHAANLFAACPDGLGYLCVRLDQLVATMKRLNRAGAQYIRVRGHGIFHVYTTSRDLAQKLLSQQQASELFAEHLSLAPSGQGHVISTSRAWHHHRHDEVRPLDPDSICIATGLGPDTIRAILDRLHQTSSVTAEYLSFRFQSPEALETFVAAVEDAKHSSNCSYEPKRTSNNADKRPAAAFGSSRFKPDPLYEALRSP
jgi:hypothetical protein